MLGGFLSSGQVVELVGATASVSADAMEVPDKAFEAYLVAGSYFGGINDLAAHPVRNAALRRAPPRFVLSLVRHDPDWSLVGKATRRYA